MSRVPNITSSTNNSKFNDNLNFTCEIDYLAVDLVLPVAAAVAV